MIINKIVKKYSNFVLQINNLNIEDRGLVGLIGNNGAGKTTLLRILSGKIKADEIDVNIMGQLKTYQNVFISKAIFAIAQESYYEGKLKRIINSFAYLDTAFNYDRCEEYLKKFCLNPNAKYKELSQGMKAQFKASIMLGLSVKVFFIDELTNGLDVFARQLVYTALQELAKDKLIVFSTHILDQDKTFFDRILFLDDGQIKYDLKRDQVIIEESGYKVVNIADAHGRKQVEIIDLYTAICKNRAIERIHGKN